MELEPQSDTFCKLLLFASRWRQIISEPINHSIHQFIQNHDWDTASFMRGSSNHSLTTLKCIQLYLLLPYVFMAETNYEQYVSDSLNSLIDSFKTQILHTKRMKRADCLGQFFCWSKNRQLGILCLKQKLLNITTFFIQLLKLLNHIPYGLIWLMFRAALAR